MSKYRITLDGKVYEMEVELVSDGSVQKPVANAEPKVATDDVKKPISTSVKPTSTAEIARDGIVVAPMPGTVIKIAKAEGNQVKTGDVVLVLEAMKMENEILAPVSGTIKKMNCVANGTVAGGEVLFEIG